MPGRGHAHQLADHTGAHSCDRLATGSYWSPFSAPESRCEVRQAGGPSGAEHGAGGLRAAPSYAENSSSFLRTRGLRSACPSDPLCPQPECGLQQHTHSWLWNVLPEQLAISRYFRILLCTIVATLPLAVTLADTVWRQVSGPTALTAMTPSKSAIQLEVRATQTPWP